MIHNFCTLTEFVDRFDICFPDDLLIDTTNLFSLYNFKYIFYIILFFFFVKIRISMYRR